MITFNYWRNHKLLEQIKKDLVKNQNQIKPKQASTTDSKSDEKNKRK